MLRRLAIAAAILAWLPAAQAQLPEAVSRTLAEVNIPEDAISTLVLRDDKVVLSHLPARPMQPASTMKLVTTLIGLEQLGPVFKGRTELRSSGDVKNGVLKGDLVVRGGADADFSSTALENMLRALRYQGVRKIDGNIVFDRTLFNPARSDVGIPPFDESPEAYYNVIPDALMINKNMLELDMRSTAKQLKVSVQPALERVSVTTSDMQLVDGDCAKWEDGWKVPEAVRQKDGKIKVSLHGSFPKDCAISSSINVIDRDDYLDRLLRQQWKALGGTIAGKTLQGVTPPDAKLLAEHVSRALPEVVRDINKPSDNTLARTVFLSLGSLEADPALGSRPLPGSTDTTYVRSDLAVRNWMRAHRIDDSGLVLENGSGLSRLERISPLQMAGLLQAGLHSTWAPEFQASMPIVAVDGTMKKRLKDSPAAGHARLKTGTLKNVVAVAGYVPDANGHPCIVVATINHDLVGGGKGRKVLDTLVDWVARSSGTAVSATASEPASAPAAIAQAK
jgi:D-alanyl-D-alanine carboxypeptidase/D-alanyl-D-alanine-endopeptidase (penicillin-binding protein 4)